MPLPLILAVAAGVAALAGVGTSIHGAVKMKEANDTMESAKMLHNRNIERFEKENKATSTDMDKLGKLELEILHSFSSFSEVFEKIKNRPTFENYSKNGITLPKYDGEKLKNVSVGAGLLLGAISGAGLGTAGGFAAAGATTAAVMALGTASTGTAIVSLSGAALTNATLAALGGGSLAAGGGGIALGTTILGVTSLGVGLLIGGLIFNFTGEKLSDKADEAWSQMKEAEKKINIICDYLINLRDTSNRYYETISKVNEIYQKHLNALTKIVTMFGHNDWNKFTNNEKNITENTVLLVGLLYNMCKVELVLKSEKEGDINIINIAEVAASITRADSILVDKF